MNKYTCLNPGDGRCGNCDGCRAAIAEICDFCGSAVLGGEHLRDDVGPCFGVTYQYDYLGPDPNDPSGEKWGWISEDGQRLYEPGDRLDDGSEFICYTEDGSPLWNEPVPYETDRREATWRKRQPDPGVKMMSPARKKLARLGWKWRTESRNRLKNLIGYSLYERFKV